jgi:hypothetical protein
MTSKLKYPFDPIEFPKINSTRFEWKQSKNMTDHLVSSSGEQIQEIIANQIICKIPAGHAVESIEPVPSTESRSGEAYLRIKLKRINNDK